MGGRRGRCGLLGNVEEVDTIPIGVDGCMNERRERRDVET